jgi:hypothetical protein
MPGQIFKAFKSCASHQNVFCSAVPRGLCGDLRLFADSEKKPQVFRKQRGSPALQNETHKVLRKGFTACHAQAGNRPPTITLPSHDRDDGAIAAIFHGL